MVFVLCAIAFKTKEVLMREEGFYWVVWNDCEQVAYWSEITICWYITGMREKIYDHDMDEIDERRITRGE